jgi:hypothetical protein
MAAVLAAKVNTLTAATSHSFFILFGQTTKFITPKHHKTAHTERYFLINSRTIFKEIRNAIQQGNNSARTTLSGMGKSQIHYSIMKKETHHSHLHGSYLLLKNKCFLDKQDAYRSPLCWNSHHTALPIVTISSNASLCRNPGSARILYIDKQTHFINNDEQRSPT